MKKDLFVAGLICILLGELTPIVGASQYWRVFTIFGILIVIGSLLAGRKKNRLQLLFEGCKLYTEINGKKILPKVVSKTDIENGCEYCLTIPPGLSTADFKQKKQAMGEALNSEVEFSYKQGKILMREVKAGGL